MNFFSLVRSISPSTACICVSALTCRVITCLASIWGVERTLGQPAGRLEPGSQHRGQTGKAGRAEGARTSGKGSLFPWGLPAAKNILGLLCHPSRTAEQVSPKEGRAEQQRQKESDETQIQLGLKPLSLSIT